MNRNITNRRELLLAKIAGRDVDINTMTPPVPINLEEELMIEIADRLEGGGGGGLASEVFPTMARVTLNVTGAGEAPTAMLLTESMWDSVCIADDENQWSALLQTGEFTVSNGQYTLAFFGTTGDGGAGFEIAYPANWEITVVSGDAVVETEEESSWVTITGDCVINAKHL